MLKLFFAPGRTGGYIKLKRQNFRPHMDLCGRFFVICRCINAKNYKSFRSSLSRKDGEVEGEEPSSLPAGSEIPFPKITQEGEKKQSSGLFFRGETTVRGFPMGARSASIPALTRDINKMPGYKLAYCLLLHKCLNSLLNKITGTASANAVNLLLDIDIGHRAGYLLKNILRTAGYVLLNKPFKV